MSISKRQCPLGVLLTFVFFSMFSKILKILRQLLAKACSGIVEFLFGPWPVVPEDSFVEPLERPFRSPILPAGVVPWTDLLDDDIEIELPTFPPLPDESDLDLDEVEVTGIIGVGHEQVDKVEDAPVDRDLQLELVNDMQTIAGPPVMTTPQSEVFPFGSSRDVTLSRRRRICGKQESELPERCAVQGCVEPPSYGVCVSDGMVEVRCEHHATRRALRTFLRLHGSYTLERILEHEHNSSCYTIKRYIVSVRDSTQIVLVAGWPAFEPKWVSKPGVTTSTHKHKCTNCANVYVHEHEFGEPDDVLHPDFPGDCDKCSRPA